MKNSSKINRIHTPTLFPELSNGHTNGDSSIKHKFRFIDLFAGIGGTRIAFESAGGECVFSSEWDKDCQKTYQANFGEVPNGDITKINEKDVSDFDVLVAGFPCQPFSSIGKRQGFMHATQGTLFYDILRILQHKKNGSGAKAFLLENVPGLTTHEDGKTFKVIIGALEDIGYKVFHKILNGSDFGVPQQRKRIYIVGFRKDLAENIEFQFPEGTAKKAYICDYLEENVEGYSISEHLQNSYLFKKDDGRPVLVDKTSKVQVKTLVSTYHKIQRLTSTFVKDGPTGVRLFTASECKAIMGFDKDFVIPVSRTQMYRQMGNSVVVPAVTAVAKAIAKKLQDIRMVRKEVKNGRSTVRPEQKERKIPERSTHGVFQTES